MAHFILNYFDNNIDIFMRIRMILSGIIIYNAVKQWDIYSNKMPERVDKPHSGM